MKPPVTLIQELHARQQTLQAMLDETRATLTQLSEYATALTTELADIERLLSGYALPTALSPAPAADGVPPAPALPLVPTLADCVEQLLAAQGPMRATALQRQLLTDYGLTVASSSLYDVLYKGRHRGYYAQTNKIWRVIRRPASTTPVQTGSE